MLITESQMNIGRGLNAFDILDNMEYLSESVYAPAMVPIVENKRFDRNIIDLENLISFAESNGIKDLGYAVQLVCESDKIDPSTIGFVINESSIIENKNLCDIANSLIQENVVVTVKPLSKFSGASILGEACLNVLMETGDFSIFDAYVDDSILNEVKDTATSRKYIDMLAKAKKQRGDDRSEEEIKAELSGKGFKDLKTELHYDTQKQDFYRKDAAAGRRLAATIKKNRDTYNKNTEGKATDINPPVMQASGNKPTTASTAPTNGDPTKEIQNIQKEWKSKPRKWIADKIAWLHNKAKEFNDKVKQDGKNAPFYNKILSYITRAIEFLTRKLHNFVAEKGHEIPEPAKDKA